MKLVDEIRIKRTARGVYGWVIWAAPLGFVILVASELIDNDLLGWAVFLLVPWLIWLTAKEKFIKRHAQQALILVALIVFALWNVLDSNGDGWLWFAAAVWIGGIAWGRWQVQHGASTLMALRGEEEELPSDQSIKDLERMVREGQEEHTAQTRPQAAPVEPTARGVDMSLEDEIRVKKTARKVYNWLFFAIPVGAAIWVLAWVVPLPLLVWSTYRDKFVKRHAQQGLLLLAGMAVAPFVLILAFQDQGLGLSVLVGGVIWLVGVFKGAQQVNEGKNTLMTRRGEEAELPGNRNISELERMLKAAQLAEQNGQPAGKTQAAAPVARPALAALQHSLQPAPAPTRSPRIVELLGIFEHGDAAARRAAVEKLAALGEVEVF